MTELLESTRQQVTYFENQLMRLPTLITLQSVSIVIAMVCLEEPSFLANKCSFLGIQLHSVYMRRITGILHLYGLDESKNMA